MREWRDILAAHRVLAADGKPCALATVVGVEGSAYRRPGARMLIAEDGRTWGGVSGGCLERDVAERARGVIAASRSYLHRYDTSDEELIDRGVSTGCGGTIEVFIQPLTADAQSPALTQLHRVLTERQPLRLATVIKTPAANGDQLGRSMLIDSDATDLAGISVDPSHRWQRVAAPAGGAEWFVEMLLPPQRLVIVGGGADAVPLVTIAKTLGWHVAVVAAKPALSLATRFSHADERYVTPADAPLLQVPIDTRDAVVVMTHNIARDASALAAMPVRPAYLGLLGPRHRTVRVLAPLPPCHPATSLHSPVGLDIGSDSPEEIALSIVAQIQMTIHASRPQRSPLPACRA
ncbi:MAG: XdhC family protein [Tepidisphaeraceae bacterium]